MTHLPKSASKQEVLARLDRLKSSDMPTHGGKVWAYVYDSALPEVAEVAAAAYTKYMDENALDFTVFPSLLRMENDIVSMLAGMFSGSGAADGQADETPAGTFTSGGTESIILAVKAARDYYHRIRPEVTGPEIILPVTAHAAFHKAAHYLGLLPVIVPVDQKTWRVDPLTVRNAISPRTIMLVGSAVNYSHGVTDPIYELGILAETHHLWLHVDACIGGFLMYFLGKLGEPVPEFDFCVPGVSSLSVDLHKYAYAPKGASVVLYRNKELRQFEMYACTRWAGYPMINTTIQSTKSGGPLAACWAVMNFLGEDGYMALAESTLRAKRALLEGLASLHDLRVLGTPEAGLVAFTSDTVDVFLLADAMRAAGWYVQVQPGRTGTPGSPGLEPSLHLTVTAVSQTMVSPFLEDLAAAVFALRSQPARREHAAEEVLLALRQPASFLAGLGIEPGRLPENMAEVNRILRLLPPELAEQLFITITSDMFTPPKDEAAAMHRVRARRPAK